MTLKDIDKLINEAYNYGEVLEDLDLQETDIYIWQIQQVRLLKELKEIQAKLENTQEYKQYTDITNKLNDHAKKYNELAKNLVTTNNGFKKFSSVIMGLYQTAFNGLNEEEKSKLIKQDAFNIHENQKTKTSK